MTFWNWQLSYHAFFETKDNVIFQLLKSSLSNEVADTLAWTWQSDLEQLTREACARQQYQNQSLDFCYKENGRLFVYTIIYMKNFKKQLIERNCHWLSLLSQEMNGHWRDVHSKNQFVFVDFIWLFKHIIYICGTSRLLTNCY